MRRALITIILIILGVVVIRFTLLRPTSVFFKIYQSKNRINLNTVIGITPKEFIASFKRKTIEFNDNYELYRLQNLKSPIPETYYVLNNNNDQKIIKGYPISLVKNDGVLEKIENIEACLINLKAFNEYTKVAGINSQEEIVRKFFLFLSDGSDFQVLNDLGDIETLLSRYSKGEKIESPFAGKQVNLKELNFPKKAYHVWFYGKGIVRFDFSFDNQGLDAVKSVNLGLLGIEEPYCC